MGFIVELPNGVDLEFRSESIVVHSRGQKEDGTWEPEFHADGVDAGAIEVTYDFMQAIIDAINHPDARERFDEHLPASQEARRAWMVTQHGGVGI